MLYEMSVSEFNSLIKKKEGYTLVEFFAIWCRQCKSLETVLENVEEDLYPKLNVYKIDCDLYPSFADEMNVLSLPTIILYQNGTEIKRLTGLYSDSHIKEWLNL